MNDKQADTPSHLMKISAILRPIPDPPPVMKATWSLENKAQILKDWLLHL